MSQFVRQNKQRFKTPLTYGLLLILFAVLLSVVATSATAQEAPAPQITSRQLEEDTIAAGNKYQILSITEVGDQRIVQAEIPVQQDTFTSSGQPNSNFGLDSIMRIGYSADPPTLGAVRSFVQFDVGAFIPSNAVINSATLQVWLSGATPAGDPPMGVLARYLDDPWSATTLTWNTTQPHWGTEIGIGDVPSGPINGLLQYSALGPVRDWVSGARPNYGIMLQGDESIRERQRILYTQNANNGLYPRLIVDFTISNDTTAPYAQVNGLPQWSASPFTVTWTGTDHEGSDPNASGIAYYDVQYSVGSGNWVDWLQTTDTSAVFGAGANGQLYQFRVRAVDKAGNIQSWNTAPVTQTTVDSVPPSVSMTQLPEYTFSSVLAISWSGTDSGGSGIAYYDVQMRENDENWQTLLSNYTGTTYTLTGLDNFATYEFRARGVDNVGNEQAWSAGPQTSTTIVNQPIAIVQPFDPNIIQPGNPNPSQVRVNWIFWTPPGTTITAFDLWVKIDGGPWSIVTTTSNSYFDYVFPTTNNATYYFEVVATNNAGQSETHNSQSEAFVIYNMNPPFIEPAVFMPFLTLD